MTSPSTKLAVPTLAGAIATVVSAITKHTGDPTTVAIAAATVINAVLIYISPHEPVHKTVKKVVKKVSPKKKVPRYVTVYDSTRVSGIGRIAATSPDAVAAYDDGLYDNVEAMRKAYPNHRVVTIAVRYGDRADYADCEKGDFTIPQAIAAWKKSEVKGIYAAGDDFHTLNTLLRSESKQPKKWLADPTGRAHLPVGFDGCQYDWEGNRDVSLVNNETFF